MYNFIMYPTEAQVEMNLKLCHQPEFLDQQQHIALGVYHQMLEKQQEHLQLSKFLYM